MKSPERRGKTRRSSLDILCGSADLFDSFAASSSILAKTTSFSDIKFNDAVKYQKYVILNPGCEQSYDVNRAIILFMQQKNFFNAQIIENEEIRSEYCSDLNKITEFLKSVTDQELFYLRNYFRRQIGLRNSVIELIDEIIGIYQKAGYEIDKITQYIQSLNRTAFIFANDFISDILSDQKCFQSLIRLLKRIEPIDFPKLENFPLKNNFFKSDSYEYQALQRIATNFDQLTADDSTFIIKNLAKRIEYRVAEEIFFEYTWNIQEFPWSSKTFLLPDYSFFTPKVFNTPFLAEKYANTTFIELLNTPQWPYYKLVQEITGIIFEINPFNIARVFWNVFNRIQALVIKMNPNLGPDFVLDFDQLFSILIMLVVGTCNNHITIQIAYASSFRAAAEYDPQLSYALGHMEGINAHLKSLNYLELKKKLRELNQNTK